MYGSILGWRLRSFGVPFFLFISVLGAGQQPGPTGVKAGGWVNEELASLCSGQLTVWESGSGVLLGWATIQRALKVDFPELRVNFRVVDPKAFIGDLAAAKGNGTLPDVVFVDNWGQGAPLIAQQKVVEMMGQARFWPANGWWFQMSAGAHQAAATAFLRWLEDSPHWQSPPMSAEGMTDLDKKQVTSAAFLAVAGMAGGGATDSVMDPDAAKLYPLSWGPACGQISRMSFPVTRFLFGNGRLAYAAVSSEARSTGGNVECSGAMYSFLVLRKGYEGWKVLLLMPRVSLEDAVRLADRFDQLGLATSSEGYAPYAPQLLSPFDWERQTRNPKQYVSWQQDEPRPVAYAVESSFGYPPVGATTYSPSRIDVVAAIDFGDIVRIPEPFGQGVQPHRWRVWAIGKDGQVALSEWRTVQFTN